MNVSMQDCYNLGWKLALVIKGIAQSSILGTYEAERRRVAQELIAIDHRLSRQISGKAVEDLAVSAENSSKLSHSQRDLIFGILQDSTGINADDFKKSMIEGHLFFQGLSINYGPSNLVAKPSEAQDHVNGSDQTAHSTTINAAAFAKRQALATGLPVGMRFNSCTVKDNPFSPPRLSKDYHAS